MGNKYTVECGSGTVVNFYLGTEWLVVALWYLALVKVDGETNHWKRLHIV